MDRKRNGDDGGVKEISTLLAGGRDVLDVVKRLSGAEPEKGIVADWILQMMRAARKSVRQQRQLKEQATRDILTGLLNRRGMAEFFAQSCAIASRSGHQQRDEGYVLAVIDLDHFKTLNDSLGHQAGDAGLVLFAKMLDVHFRGSDSTCRIGGDEFVVILERTTVDAAAKLLEKFRVDVESSKKLSFKDRSLKERQTTVSIGAVAFSCSDRSKKELPGDFLNRMIRNADEAMYKAKKAGRNNVKVFT